MLHSIRFPLFCPQASPSLTVVFINIQYKNREKSVACQTLQQIPSNEAFLKPFRRFIFWQETVKTFSWLFLW